MTTSKNRKASSEGPGGPQAGGLSLVPIPVLEMIFGCNNIFSECGLPHLRYKAWCQLDVIPAGRAPLPNGYVNPI